MGRHDFRGTPRDHAEGDRGPVGQSEAQEDVAPRFSFLAGGPAGWQSMADVDDLLDCPVVDSNLTESVVRPHLRDHPGEARCADCVARDLGLHPSTAISPILALLADRQPPFASGRCSCGANGLMYLVS